MNKCLVIWALVTIICLAGCATFMDGVTPAFIDKRVSNYIGEIPGVGVDSLRNAKRAKKQVIITYRDNQLGLRRDMQDDKNKYGDCIEQINLDISEAEVLQKNVMDGVGAWPGLNSVLFGAGGLLIGGKYIKRPKDYAPEEVDEEDKE